MLPRANIEASTWDAFGADRLDGDTPHHGGVEDFSFYLEKVPGCYLCLGNGEGGHRDASYVGPPSTRVRGLG